ncbi:uncharacterized protein LOC135162886 [Diachasmimorpha longicaudata]|uniref:uncharacterized protein LOC135162886 n=1 Tax=Diachasmimorpha longicaudata TaxID=58733 RepID=UPI0030B91B5F
MFSPVSQARSCSFMINSITMEVHAAKNKATNISKTSANNLQSPGESRICIYQLFGPCRPITYYRTYKMIKRNLARRMADTNMWGSDSHYTCDWPGIRVWVKAREKLWTKWKREGWRRKGEMPKVSQKQNHTEAHSVTKCPVIIVNIS